MSTLRWTTAGESHGAALVGVLEGLPLGVEIDAARVDAELARRQRGYGRSSRMQLEHDHARVLAGLRAGRTLGSPIALVIDNVDDSLERLPVPASARPGHADLAGCQKLTTRDPRAVLERASARETAMRVALGAVARQLLESFGVELFGHVVELGGIAARADAFEAAGEERSALREGSAFLALDAAVEPAWRAKVDAAQAAGDTLGGVFEVRVLGLPPGLGGYANAADRLTSRLGAALLSIPAIKGLEFGLGFDGARRPGSQFHDPIVARPGPWGRFARTTNHAGGLEGGLTTGEPLIVRAALKPLSTLKRGLPTIEFASGASVRATYQRSDVTAVPAASVVGEALAALELTRAFLAKFGGDALEQVQASVEDYRRRLASL